MATSTEAFIASSPAIANIANYIDGLYYFPFPIITVATKTVTAGRLYFIGPFVAKKNATITKLGMRVSTGSTAGTKVSMGVYPDVNGLPGGELVGGATGNVLTDSSAADAEATGLSIPIVKGKYYWLAADFEGAPILVSNSSTVMMRSITVTSTTNPAVVIKKTVAYAATLPTACPAITASDFADETLFSFWYRFG